MSIQNTITMSDGNGNGGAQKRSEEEELAPERVKKIRLFSNCVQSDSEDQNTNESGAPSLLGVAASGSVCNHEHWNDATATRTGEVRLDRLHSIHVLADPFLNHIVTCMQEDLTVANARADEFKDRFQALAVAPDSEPLQLLERCRRLEREKDRLENEVSEGRVAELEGEIQLLRHYIMDLEAKYEELQGQHTQLEEQSQQHETELLAASVRLKSALSERAELFSRPQSAASLPPATQPDPVVKMEPLPIDPPSPAQSTTAQDTAQSPQPEHSIPSHENPAPTSESPTVKSEPASLDSITHVISDGIERRSGSGGGEIDEQQRKSDDLDRQSYPNRDIDTNGTVGRLRDEVALLQNQLAREKSERERLRELLAKERQKVDTHEQEAKRVKDEHDSLKRKLLQALTDKQAMRKQGDEVHEELKEQKRKTSEEKARADSLSQQLREEKETWAKEREKLESKCDKKHKETEGLRSDVKDATERARVAQENAAKVTNERDTLQNTLQAIKNKNEGLLTTAEKQLAELEGELTNMRAINGQQSEEIRKLRYRLETMEKEADGLAGALKAGRETVSRAEMAAKDLLVVKRRLQVAVEDVDRLQGAIQMAEDEREKIRRELVLTLDEKDEILHQLRKDREIHKQQIGQYVRDIELVMADRDRLARALRL